MKKYLVLILFLLVVIKIVSSQKSEVTTPSNATIIAYDITIWVDGVETLTFENASQPYNVTVKVFNSDTLQPIKNAKVEFNERSGASIFTAPQSSATSMGRGVVYTDSNGFASLTIIPTGYAAPSDYNLSVIVYNNESGAEMVRKYMNLANTGAVEASFPISIPNRVEVANTLTRVLSVWSYSNEWVSNSEGRRYSVNVSNTGVLEVESDYLNVSLPVTFEVYAYKEGAQQGVKVFLKEKNGNLMFVTPQSGVISYGIGNATTDSSGWANFTIIPTGYGASNYNVTLIIYDQNGNYLNETWFTVDTSTLTDYFSTGETIKNQVDVANTLTKVLTVWSYANQWLGYE